MSKAGSFAAIFWGSLLLLGSCATSLPEISLDTRIHPPDALPCWSGSDFEGLKILRYEESENLVRFYALAVDLEAPGFRFVLTPPDPGGQGETRSAKVSSFAQRYHLSAAINGAPHHNRNPLNRQNAPCDVAGLYLYEGTLLSEANSYFDALYLLSDGSILMGPQDEIPEGTRWAVGGLHLVLEEGQNLGKEDARHPRSVIGLSGDQRILYLVVVDGRQEDCAGMTTEELGLWMLWLGASQAINMDGGGSSSLVLAVHGVRAPLNSPIHRGKPGLERAVASHIGVLLPE